MFIAWTTLLSFQCDVAARVSYLDQWRQTDFLSTVTTTEISVW